MDLKLVEHMCGADRATEDDLGKARSSGSQFGSQLGCSRSSVNFRDLADPLIG
jgi:hypothetical protein